MTALTLLKRAKRTTFPPLKSNSSAPWTRIAKPRMMKDPAMSEEHFLQVSWNFVNIKDKKKGKKLTNSRKPSRDLGSLRDPQHLYMLIYTCGEQMCMGQVHNLVANTWGE